MRTDEHSHSAPQFSIGELVNKIFDYLPMPAAQCLISYAELMVTEFGIIQNGHTCAAPSSLIQVIDEPQSWRGRPMRATLVTPAQRITGAVKGAVFGREGGSSASSCPRQGIPSASRARDPRRLSRTGHQSISKWPLHVCPNETRKEER